ncbi:hypothetical protein VTO73DRAFT_849 [Trametes versicolor]
MYLRRTRARWALLMAKRTQAHTGDDSVPPAAPCSACATARWVAQAFRSYKPLDPFNDAVGGDRIVAPDLAVRAYTPVFSPRFM